MKMDTDDLVFIVLRVIVFALATLGLGFLLVHATPLGVTVSLILMICFAWKLAHKTDLPR
jgi:hypothetical protein